jgi:hypothetical protein
VALVVHHVFFLTSSMALGFLFATDEGFNILVGPSSEILFYPTHLNTAGTPSAPYSFWNIPQSIESDCEGNIIYELNCYQVGSFYSLN